MTNENILDAIGGINENAVQDAKAYKRPKSKRWFRWGAMAACLCLVIGGFAAYQAGIFKPLAGTEENDTDTESAAYGFYLNGNHTVLYFPISFDLEAVSCTAS